MPFFSIGAAATLPSEVCEDLAAKPIAAHQELLVTAVRHQLGPLAGAVCRAVTQAGQLSLMDISAAVRRDEDVRGVAAAAANRASATGEKTTAVPATHQVGTNLHVDLGELASANDLIHDVAVKEVVTRLVLHRVLYADPAKQLYGIRYGSGLLLRVFFPLLVHCVRQQYGEAAKCVLLAVYQLGVVPPVAAVQVTLSRNPSLTRDAVEYAVTQLVQDQWLVPVVVPGGGLPSPLNAPGGSGLHAADLWNATAPYRIGLEAALHFLFNVALEQAVAERYADGGLALTLVRALRRRAAPGSSFGEAVASWHELASELPAVSAGTRRDRAGQPTGTLPDNTRSAEAVQRCLQRLSQPIVLFSCDASLSVTPTLAAATTLTTATAGGASMNTAIGCGGGGAGGSAAAVAAVSLPATRALLVQPQGQRGFYALDGTTAVRLLQEAACERVVYARFGVLGVRIAKLLLQHHFLEERTLAEQSVATYTKTRDVLHHMFTEGFLLQQEVPKSGALAERAAKGSIFLWGLNWHANLLPVVRERLAKTLSIARVKLHEAQQELAAISSDASVYRPTSSSPSLGGAEASTRAVTDDAEAQWKFGLSRAVQQSLQAQRTVTGLQSCVMSLLRLLLVVDFF